MLKAFAIKGVAFGAAVPVISVVPPGWGWVVFAATFIGLTIFFTYQICHPSGRLFAKVVERVPGDNVVAITFDDGPDPVYTPQILDILEAHQARATFFVIGERAAAHPELVRRIRDAGHSVGTHTQHHLVKFHFGTPSFVKREIEDAVDVVTEILNARPTLFRPPQGLRTPCFASGWARTRDLTCVTWSARAYDSRPTTTDRIVARISRRLEPGAIVALHDGTGLGGGSDRRATLEALATILTECKSRGLRCVALSEAFVEQEARDSLGCVALSEVGTPVR